MIITFQSNLVASDHFNFQPDNNKGSTVNNTHDTLTAARSSARLVFGGALSLMLSIVSLSSAALKLLTVCFADLKEPASRLNGLKILA